MACLGFVGELTILNSSPGCPSLLQDAPRSFSGAADVLDAQDSALIRKSDVTTCKEVSNKRARCVLGVLSTDLRLKLLEVER